MRSDRREFLNAFGRGGGVMAFIKRDLEFCELKINEKTYAEMLMFQVKIGMNKLIIMNVYFPPYETRMTMVMVSELARSLRRIRMEHIDAEIIAAGDFNMSNLQWKDPDF